MRRCVYTALTAGYETLNDQLMARQSDLPFICFTDDPALVSDTWDIRLIRLPLPGDPIRSQRAFKLLAHRYLPEFDASLYIDNSVLLEVPPERVFDAVDLSAGIAVPEHSFRDTVLDEFVEVGNHRLDDPARIAEQLLHYRTHCPEILAEKPLWAAIMLRDHGNAKVAAAMETWLAHIYRYARRDQLSSRAAFAEAGLRPEVLRIDNFRSWFHSWPHMAGRKTERRLWPATDDAARLLATELRAVKAETCAAALQENFARLSHEQAALLGSTSWRATAPLRALVGQARRLTVNTRRRG